MLVVEPDLAYFGLCLAPYFERGGVCPGLEMEGGNGRERAI